MKYRDIRCFFLRGKILDCHLDEQAFVNRELTEECCFFFYFSFFFHIVISSTRHSLGKDERGRLGDLNRDPVLRWFRFGQS